MRNRSFAGDHGPRIGVSLIIKKQGSGRGKPRRKIEKRATLLGTCLACLSRPRLPSRILFFPIPISLPRLLLVPPSVPLLASPRLAPRPALLLVFLVGFRKVRCSVLVAVLPPFRIRSEGLKPAKLRNRVTQRHPLPRGKHTTRVHARNITQAI